MHTRTLCLLVSITCVVGCSAEDAACERLEAASRCAREGSWWIQTTEACPTAAAVSQACIDAMNSYADCVNRYPGCEVLPDDFAACTAALDTGVCRLAPGAACSQDLDCLSVTCTSGRCACASRDQPCAASSDCCDASLSCTNGLCQ
jgi:hypothetical protein